MSVGIFNTLFDTTLLLILYHVTGLPEVVANTISVSISITFSYFLNHRIVFRDPAKYSLKKYLRFFAITGLGIICIQDLTIYLITSHVWVVADYQTVNVLNHMVSLKTIELIGAKLLAVLLGMAWNFLLYKYVVFKPHHTKEDSEDSVIIA